MQGTRGATVKKVLDPLKKLPIVRDPSAIALLEESTVEQRGIRRDAAMELPIPESVLVPTYEQDVAARVGKFVPTLGFVRRSGKGPIMESDSYVEYDLELEDEAWLKGHSRWGEGVEAPSRLPRLVFERMLDVLEKYNGAVKSAWHANETLPAAELLAVVGESLGSEAGRFPLPPGLALGSPGWKACALDVHGYWLAKRKRLGKPLLRRYWAQASSSDNHPHHTFRAPPADNKFKLRRTRRNDLDVYKKMLALKGDLERNLALLKMCCDREKLKYDLVAVMGDLFQQEVYDAVDTSGVKRVSLTLERLAKEREVAAAAAAAAAAFASASGGGGGGGGMGQVGLPPLAKNSGLWMALGMSSLGWVGALGVPPRVGWGWVLVGCLVAPIGGVVGWEGVVEGGVWVGVGG